MVTQEDVAEKLLWGLWRGISEDYKKRYLKNIWEQFENAIRSASYTDKLTVFLSNFQRRIPTLIEAQHNKDVMFIVQSGEDDAILNWLRAETTYLTIIVRLKNQDKKEAYQAAKNNKKLDPQLPSISNPEEFFND